MKYLTIISTELMGIIPNYLIFNKVLRILVKEYLKLNNTEIDPLIDRQVFKRL